MSESIFRAEGEHFVPTEHAGGPWDPAALHGGAPAALITRAFERTDPRGEMRLARLSFELLRPVPSAPLRIVTRIVRDGRRVQELAAELSAVSGESSGEERVVCRASALRVQAVPGGLPAEACTETAAGDAMPGPELGVPVRFALDHSDGPSFATSAMEMRFLGGPPALGPARVWMRLSHPLLASEEPTPLQRLAATADFGNGVSATLPFEQFVFINADLSIRVQREPRGEWIGLDARTLLVPGGTALAESVLHDEEGPVGRAAQTLVVAQR